MISVAISSLSRAAVSPVRRAVARRNLSHACAQSVRRLNDILEEYRAENYSQEFPKRFRKDIVRAAADGSPRLDDVPLAVSARGIEHVLHNIGMGDRMSRSEIECIVSEVGTCPTSDGSGENDCVIFADRMLDLISKNAD